MLYTCSIVNGCFFYSNGGECVNTYSGYFCRCPDNWEGQNCDRDVNECSRYTGLPMLLNG